MAAESFNFTKQGIAKLPWPARGTKTYRDTKEAGLSLYVTGTGVVTFFVRKRIDGRDQRIVIGRYPDMTIEQARKAAQILKGHIAAGRDPSAERNAVRQEQTLGAFFAEYLERHAKLHNRTWRSHEREYSRYLAHWANRKLSAITQEELSKLHARLGRECGHYQANRVLARVSALYNKAIAWGWQGTNPAVGIQRFKERSRDRFVQADELPRLFAAIAAEPNETTRDYIWLSILTGARRSNVVAMRWSEIDWHGRVWRIPATKSDEPQLVPLTDRTIEILAARQETAESPWVFPSETSRSGHLVEPKKCWRRILDRAGIDNLRLHDLRRTMGSYQAITGASLPVIGKALGHRSHRATEIYARLDLDPVRNAMDAATSIMFGEMQLALPNQDENCPPKKERPRR